jgi:hypothetical protein
LDALSQNQLDAYDIQLDRALRQIGPETGDAEVEWLAHEMVQQIEALALRAGLDSAIRQRRDKAVGELIESSLWGIFNDRQLAVLKKVVAEVAADASTA